MKRGKKYLEAVKAFDKAQQYDLGEAIEMLIKEYERAKNMEHVQKPLAWALYQVWKKADKAKTKGK